jgi:hypothetical protein
MVANFSKVFNFWKVDLRFWDILLENAQNTEGSNFSQLIDNQRIKPARFLKTSQVWY